MKTYTYKGVTISKGENHRSLWVVNLNTGLRYGYRTRFAAERKVDEMSEGEG